MREKKEFSQNFQRNLREFLNENSENPEEFKPETSSLITETQ